MALPSANPGPAAPIWDQTTPGQPHTHVFIIGVGKYRHLNGGEGALAQRNMGMGQLTSPPASARKLAEWFIHPPTANIAPYNNPDAPLGSVFLLLSEPGSAPFPLPGGAPINPPAATIENIERHLDAWLAKVKEHPANIAIFYFCGHGVLIQGDLTLLAEDYGARPRQPFDGAIDFETLHKGMALEHPGVQCYFIDACSNVPVSDLDIERSGARGFFTVAAPPPSQQTMLVVRAAAPGNTAYGVANRPSRFTQTLLDCLQGRGCHPTRLSGNWVVTTQSLAFSISQWLAWLNNNRPGPIQIPNISRNQGVGRLNVLNQPPIVPVTVQFQPDSAIADARLTLTSRQNPAWVSRRPAQPGAWQLPDVRAGSYELEAAFQSALYRDFSQELIVIPPGPVEELFYPATQ